jgi:hypothetical protein
MASGRREGEVTTPARGRMPPEGAEEIEDGLLNLLIADTQRARDVLQLNECYISNNSVLVYEVLIDVLIPFAQQHLSRGERNPTQCDSDGLVDVSADRSGGDTFRMRERRQRPRLRRPRRL